MNEAELAAGLPATPGYRYAQRVGRQLFVAGQVPHDTHGRLVGPDDPAAQALQCLHNLRTLLQLHGFSMQDLRRIVVYVVGEPARLAAAWRAVTGFFDGEVPPATLLGVERLGHAGQLVEIDATVLKARSRPPAA